MDQNRLTTSVQLLPALFGDLVVVASASVVALISH
jgi:hypothetical protein